MTSLYQPPLTPYGTPTSSAGGGALGINKSPFFTLGNQFLPRNLHDVIRWVRFITIQSPVVTEVLRKLSTFPITSFTYSSNDPAVRSKYEDLVKSFNLRSTLHNIGFQYFTIGNVFISVNLPIHRTLTCQHCKEVYNAATAEFISFKAYKFVGQCPKCQLQGTFTRKDTKSTNISEMKLIVWDPLNISVNHNPISGKSKYYYKIPNEIRRQVQLGNMLYLESLPWEMVDCIQQNKDFEFAPGMIYHMKNVDTGFATNGICIPPMVSHFNLVFYQATLRKANESIAADYMAPLRVVFPQAQTGNSDPVVSMSMRNFASKMEEAFVNHRKDNNSVLIAPVPIGYQAISGEGKTLLVYQEIREAEESLLLSMGVSRELMSGTTNWTSSTVGLRMLKNTLDSYVGQVEDLLEWIGVKCSEYLGISPCTLGLTPFQLTDDEAVKNIFLNLVQSGNVSMTTLYEAMGRSYDEEQNRMLEEMKSKAIFQVRAQFETEQAKFLEARRLAKDDENTSDYKEALGKASQVLQELQAMDPNTAQMMMSNLKIQDFPLYILVTHLMEEAANNAAAGITPGVQPNPDDTDAPPGAGGPGGDPNQGPPGSQGGEDQAQAEDGSLPAKPKSESKEKSSSTPKPKATK